MKKNQWIIWVGVGLAAWYWWNQKKKAAASSAVLPGSNGSTPYGFSAKSAGQEASTIVADVLDKTTFLPDLSTNRDLYKQDQSECK